MKRFAIFIFVLAIANAANDPELLKARDHQDRAALEKILNDRRAAASKQPNDPASQYRLALAASYYAEVATELRDKGATKSLAQTGIDAAERAVTLKPDSAEHQRILGTLCGQIISGNSLSAIKYGKCALEAVNKAIELDPNSSVNYVSHGVGNYYLPPAFGGGIDLAIKDFRKAIDLDPKNADAWLWLGIALRRANQPEEARKAIAKSLELNPDRLWAKQQLEKTPGS
ncbi:MAG TPA: tetratricopeptide repeat protein [Bryobacteraceae bacterium]|nr:tetratricopeptide repeat protein [Bryobacteraceae bacterium]